MSEPTAPLPATSRRRAALVLVMLILVALVGTALVLTLDRLRTEAGPPELTASERAILAQRLAAIDTDIDRLVDQAAALALAGRDVLTRTRALDPDGADAAIATGSQASTAIAGLRERLIKQREVVTAGIDTTRLVDTDRARIGTIDQALVGATQLPPSWTSVLASSADALELVRSIQAHDARVAEATAAARDDDLAAAITTIRDAQRLLVPAHAVRATAHAAGTDVTTLDDLLARLDTYDDALERLYTLLAASGGAVTDPIRSVYEEVGAAQASLPLDQDALMLIVSDLAGPATTAALVDIEAHRALLADAVAARPDTSGG